MISPQHKAAQRRSIWPPEPGTFMLRLTRNGWRVPARIVHDDQGWHAEIDGIVHPADSDPAKASMLADIWHHGIKIDQVEFDWLFAVKEWARVNAPEHPSLSPHSAIDPQRLTPIPPSARVLADISKRGHHGKKSS